MNTDSKCRNTIQAQKVMKKAVNAAPNRTACATVLNERPPSFNLVPLTVVVVVVDDEDLEEEGADNEEEEEIPPRVVAVAVVR